MPTISTIERVKLNYAVCTISSIVVYTFSVSTFASQFSKLWLHTFYFIVAEAMKLLIIQKMYALDVSYNQEGIKKRRANKVGESVKFGVLMILTVFSYAFICIIMGGEQSQLETFVLLLKLSFSQLHRWRTTKRRSRSQHY